VSLSVESGACAPIRGPGGARAPLVLGATRWLEGDVDAIFRLAFGSAPEPGGRGADRFVLASAGARWSVLPDPVRPQLSVEAGFRRWSGGRLGATLAAAAGVEVFVASDLSVAARAAARFPLGAGRPEADLALGVSVYF